jgi:hypothetical protein
VHPLLSLLSEFQLFPPTTPRTSVQSSAGSSLCFPSLAKAINHSSSTLFQPQLIYPAIFASVETASARADGHFRCKLVPCPREIAKVCYISPKQTSQPSQPLIDRFSCFDLFFWQAVLLDFFHLSHLLHRQEPEILEKEKKARLTTTPFLTYPEPF